MRWIIAANSKKFNHHLAFEKYGYIDWKKSCNFKTDDIVYVYCTKPIKAIRFKAVVTFDNMIFSEITNMEELWSDKAEYEAAQSGQYFRLKLISKTRDDNLSLDNLKLHGLINAPQGPQKLKEETVEYIESIFNNNAFSEIDEESFSEGRSIMRKHISRERSQELISRAKLKFKEKHEGRLFCEACGFDFSEKYGDLGHDFIEAHHIKKPVSEMQDNEKTRIDDIVMLCSNCHRMIHRKKPWVTKDNLKDIFK